MEIFIQQALVFIIASVIFVPLFQKLGFGSVLGYLLAGICVGPYGFKFIRDSQSILHFSELGVVMLLFVIGLEIQPRKLWAMRKNLLGFGGLQIFLCSLIFSLIALIFEFSFTSALILGFTLSLSSTAFAIQTLNEKKLFHTEFGSASFSVLLVQDLMAIPALAIIPALVQKIHSEQTHNTSPNLLLALGLIIALVFVSRFLIRPIFRMIATTRSREVFTTFSFLIVLGVSALMQEVGLSAALGTFIAGVLLADSEYRHELETNIEPFKGLLMGLFFIAVGMGVNLNLVQQSPMTLILATLGYLTLKGLIIYSIGRVLKMSHINAKLMALTISQGGEFAFVIFGILAGTTAVNSHTLETLTAIITFSMMLTPLFNIINEKWDLLASQNKDSPQYDQIENEAPEVVIAGFGRFGQAFGRILRAQNIAFVAIDHDANQIEMVRRFGNKVYYGDASQQDLLETAGIKHAKYFILAIDDVETSLRTATTVKNHFPHLKIYARARNRGHAFDLMERGITHIKRELFDSSVAFTQELLVDMGYEEKHAKRITERFTTHDEIMLKEQFNVRKDEKVFVSLSKQGSYQLAQVLAEESKQSLIDTNSN